MTQPDTKLSPGLLEQRVEGYNLLGATLGENLGSIPTLLVFLRHFG